MGGRGGLCLRLESITTVQFCGPGDWCWEQPNVPTDRFFLVQVLDSTRFPPASTAYSDCWYGR